MASDALICLRRATGDDVTLNCPCDEETGVLLEGEPESPAVDALSDRRSTPVAAADVLDTFLLTRLEVALDADATVGEVNAALQSIGALIVAMNEGIPIFTISVPRQNDLEGLDALAATLMASDGILFAGRASEGAERALPGVGVVDDYLMKQRFPAAWNASALALENCQSRKVPVIVGDYFKAGLPAGYLPFLGQIPNFTLDSSSPDTFLHGYDVVTTLAALFDGQAPTGANPFSECLDVIAVNRAGLGWAESLPRILAAAPLGQHAIISSSVGFRESCGPSSVSPCTDPSAVSIAKPLERIADTALLRVLMTNRGADILFAGSAGNELDDNLANIYPGVGDARFDSPFNMAASFGSDLVDASFNAGLWGEVCTESVCFPSLVQQADRDIASNLLTDHPVMNTDVFSNGVVVGSAGADGLSVSASSDTGAQVFAIGEGVDMIDGSQKNGTSFAAPQVAGLASYLWLLSPELRSRPVSDTLTLIRANTSQTMLADLIDPYSAVLSLDESGVPTPVSAPIRFAILDVDNDGEFDIDDVTTIHGSIRGTIADPTLRSDLNGDGVTGSGGARSFDLDLSGQQFGAPALDGEVIRTVGPFSLPFNETIISDEEILCYYAWSDLYTNSAPGDAADPRLDLSRDDCPVFDGAVYAGTIEWNHQHAPDDEDTQSVEFTVVADITMTVNSDFTLTPSGTITFDLTAVSDCGIETHHATGSPSTYSGTFTGTAGSLSGSVSGTGTDDCTQVPITVGFDGQVAGKHVFENGILASIDFNAEFFQDCGPGCFVSDVFTGELTPQPTP